MLIPGRLLTGLRCGHSETNATETTAGGGWLLAPDTQEGGQQRTVRLGKNSLEELMNSL